MEQQIRFCTTSDGVRIAYATVGEGPGLPILYVRPWPAYLEKDWEKPEGRAYFEGMAEGGMLAIYDRRGVGSSQREVDEISLENQLADLNAVVDSLRLERFHLMGQEDGGALAVAYAAQHPERVSRLVLWAPIIYGADVAGPQEHRSFAQLAREDWGLARREISRLAFPEGPIDWQRWISAYIREAVSGEVAAKYIEWLASVDVRSLAAEVRAPTLVLHRRGQRNVPVVACRGAAALIPDARLAVLEGTAAPVFFDAAQAVAAMHAFLAPGRAQAAAAPGGFATVLFTDITSSTVLTQRLGDEKAQELVRAHNAIVREALKAHGGLEIKHTGDGIMASFASPSSALECAAAIQRAVNGSAIDNLVVHVGVNAGEPVAEDNDLFGTSVQLARRICDKASGGEILVSDVVRQLVAGKGFLFADRGDVVLRGFEDPVRVYEVRWRTDG